MTNERLFTELILGSDDDYVKKVLGKLKTDKCENANYTNLKAMKVDVLKSVLTYLMNWNQTDSKTLALGSTMFHVCKPCLEQINADEKLCVECYKKNHKEQNITSPKNDTVNDTENDTTDPPAVNNIDPHSDTDNSVTVAEDDKANETGSKETKNRDKEVNENSKRKTVFSSPNITTANTV